MGVAITARAREAFGLARSAGLCPWPLMARGRKEAEAVKVKVTIEITTTAAEAAVARRPGALGRSKWREVDREMRASRRAEEVALPYTAPAGWRIAKIEEAPAPAVGSK